MHTLLNWLWQGSAVALAAFAILRVLTPEQVRARTAILWTSLAGVLALPLIPTLWSAWAGSSASAPVPYVVSSVTVPAAWWSSDLAVMTIVAVWSLAHTGWLLAAGRALSRARGRCRAFPREVEARLSCWNRVTVSGRRRPRLMLSDEVGAACVLAGRSPLIAMAPSLLERLNDDDLDRVAVHEWAHVQRGDDVANAVLLIVRTIAGWHPAVWWLDHELRTEREIACDEMAVHLTGSAKAYARCLVRIAELPRSAPRALPAISMASASGLGRRIPRILAFPHARLWPWRGWTAATCAVLGTFALGIGSVQIVAAAESAIETAMPFIDAPMVDDTRGAATIPVSAANVSGTRADNRAASGTRAQRSRVSQEAAAAADQSAAPRPTATADLRAASGDPDPGPGALPSSSPAYAFGALQPAAPAHAPSAGAAPPPPTEADSASWASVGDGGVAIGRGSKKAGVSIAGFFSRFGKRVAGSF